MPDPLKDALTIAQSVKRQVDTMIDTGIMQVKAMAPEIPAPGAGLPEPTELLKTFEGMLPPGLPKLSELAPAPPAPEEKAPPAEAEAYVAPAGVITAEVIPAEVAPVEAIPEVERRLWYPRG